MTDSITKWWSRFLPTMAVSVGVRHSRRIVCKRWWNWTYISVSLLALQVGGCRPSYDCEKGSLGTVGDKGQSIEFHEVREFVGQSAAAGRPVSEAEAFRDILWQEVERQALGLPGGPQTTASRRQAVRQYASALKSQRRDPVRVDRQRVPTSTKLTACGQRLLDQQRK